MVKVVRGVFLILLVLSVLGNTWASSLPDTTKLSYFHPHPIPKRLCQHGRERSRELKLDFSQTFFQAKVKFMERPVLIPESGIPIDKNRREKILVAVEEVLQGSVPSETFYLHYLNTFDTDRESESSYNILVGESLYMLGEKIAGKVHVYPLSVGQRGGRSHGVCFHQN